MFLYSAKVATNKRSRFLDKKVQTPSVLILKSCQGFILSESNQQLSDQSETLIMQFSKQLTHCSFYFKIHECYRHKFENENKKSYQKLNKNLHMSQKKK